MPSNATHDFDPRNLPQELLTAIGLAIASAAQTESIVDMAIAGCAGVDGEYGSAITTHMAMPLKLSVLRSVAEIRIDDLDHLDELDVILDDIERAFQKRNIIAHQQWYRDGRTGAPHTVKQTARTRLDIDLVPVTVDEVRRSAGSIYQSGMALMTFLGLRNLVPALPSGKPRGHKSRSARKARRVADR
jgi:hypothetical protein